MQPFHAGHHDLGFLSIQPLRPESAVPLASALSAMPPWSVIGWPAERMLRAFQRKVPSVLRFEVLAGDELAGVVTIQDPFLYGPYLQLLAVLPGFQGKGVGLRLLEWMEDEARKEEARQLWLCVSTFNTRAQAFYTRVGFEPVAIVDQLASAASDELLMRKRLSYHAD